MNIKDFTDAEISILKIAGWIEYEYSLQEIHEKTKMEITEIEKIMETFITKKIATKRANGFSFNYAVSGNSDTLRDLQEEWWDSLKDRICP